MEKAKELLAEAGWKSDRTLKMVVTSARESMAAVIQQNLAEAGIQVEVQTVELATMFSGLQDGTYDLGICGSTAMDYPLWMAGYYDNKMLRIARLQIPNMQRFRMLLHQNWMRRREWNWFISIKNCFVMKCPLLCCIMVIPSV
mgnify:CR=1 FL=1